jgi:anaerobic selenocysteine-containing dehydrogenase
MITPPAMTFREWNGPLTADLVREPAKFGLGQVPSRLVPDATTKAICGFCSTGCGLKIHLKDGEAINLTPDPDYPVNIGTACPKGWEALSVLDAPDRAKMPVLHGKEVDWDTALRYFCDTMRGILDKHGPEAAAFLSTGQIMFEEMAFLGALAKFGMGMIHGDGNTRQCMATAVTAYKQSFGFDAPPFTYADFEESDTLMSSSARIHASRIRSCGSACCATSAIPQIIVVDPRTTETAMAATQHLRHQAQERSHAALRHCAFLLAMAGLDNAFIARSHERFDEFAEFVRSSRRSVSRRGNRFERRTQFGHFARTIIIAASGFVLVDDGRESKPRGTRTAQAIINLALMTGNIGKPGTGANSASPASAMRWARASSRTRRTCSAVMISAIRRIARRSRCHGHSRGAHSGPAEPRV